jgi:hypothetical protein
MWGETTASLSHLANDAGWEHEYFMGVDLVTHHENGVAIIVTAGDSATGFERHTPQVRYERKEVTTRLVNGGLDDLWDAVRGRVDGWGVWFLLHHLDRGELVVPAELSLPVSVNSHGAVAGWVERIIVPTFEDVPGAVSEVPAVPSAPVAPVVDVRRRAG